MNFTEMLGSFIGRSIEAFLTNQFVQGTLLSVGDGFFTLQVTDPNYNTPITQSTILVQNVEFVRILAA
ncbi:hypothetical protein [Paenibacillus harenae]|uniref:DUF2642 domain-containing protein n=1 Tax=Paenibacillus harenae TaxID=306543 RepID=A0ABT9TXX2_PAEHA|nr:hypothetical protein [Paenibacillus harenae]MDQ0060247.1 hypothetical protein [Paenibacillus harenae]MDQ0112217.1 hypothetical protein [Paenibacillus harenae]